MKKLFYSILTLTLGLVLSSAGCNQDAYDPTFDEGVTIAGLTWATRNVAAPGKFAAKPEDTGMYYQWNRKIGWSATNPITPSPSEGTWGTSAPSGTTWAADNNPCPKDWVVPTRAQLQALIETDSKWEPLNSVNGRVYGSAPNVIFLPAKGYLSNVSKSLNDDGTQGVYWSSDQYNNDNSRARSIGFSSLSDGSLSPDSYSVKLVGHTIRCVKKTP
ncbi:MAG: fibrobacter succinogenes major paralogous domain-containing protein [Bacteroidales bacterium]|nr:fibrobacter succinogenes major paralogous domain-containing protein [Bacteroidales bacterium]